MGSWQELDARQMPVRLTPALTLVAALDYMANADDEYTLEETNAALSLAFRAKNLEGVDYEELVTSGTVYAKNTPLDTFLTEAAPILNEEQKLCVLTNLADISLIDETVDYNERRVLSAFLRAFSMSPERIRPYFQGIQVKNNLSVFETPVGAHTASGLTPALVLLISMFYMADADDDFSLEEQDVMLMLLLKSRGLGGMDFKELERRGMSYYQSTSLEDFLAEATPLLSDTQKLCILINLADVSFADQVVAFTEDDVFSAFLDAFGLTPEQIEPYLQGILAKSDLSVFSPHTTDGNGISG